MHSAGCEGNPARRYPLTTRRALFPQIGVKPSSVVCRTIGFRCVYCSLTHARTSTLTVHTHPHRMARPKSRLSRAKGRRQGTHKTELKQRALASPSTNDVGAVCNRLLERCGCGDPSALHASEQRGQEYGEVSQSFARWLLLSVIGPGPHTVLDFGCGRGLLCLQLALLCGSRQWRIEGVEVVRERTLHYSRLMASYRCVWTGDSAYSLDG